VGVVVADVAPPSAAGHDRRHDDRADAVRLEQDPLLGGQVAEVPRDQAPGRELALPAREVGESARVLRDRQRQDALRVPFGPPLHVGAVDALDPLDQDDAPGTGRRADPAEDLGQGNVEGSPAMNRSAAKVTASRMTSRRSGPVRSACRAPRAGLQGRAAPG
jgi:hypothetical protein